MSEKKKIKIDSVAEEFGQRLVRWEQATVGHWRKAAKFPQQCTKDDQGFITRMAKIAELLGLDDGLELLPRLEALAAEVSIEKVFRSTVTIKGNDARVKIRVARRESMKSTQPVATGFSCDIRRVPELVGELQWALATAREESREIDGESSGDDSDYE
jgi:hypothetical protein